MTEIAFEVPNATVTDLDVKAANSLIHSVPASSATIEVDRREQESAKAREYFTTHSVAILVNELLSDVMLERPEDPIDFMAAKLLRSVFDMDPALRAEKDNALNQSREACLAYCKKYKLPQLVDELLGGLVSEQSIDEQRFAVSWLRWNKMSFIERHKPEGYYRGE